MLKKKLKKNNSIEIRYANWLSQIVGLTLTTNFYGIIGRGGAKTTDMLAERLQEMVWDMPGAPVALVSDTYSNLQKNVLPTLLEGLRLKGWQENTHYVIGKEPPEHFDPAVNRIISYKHIIYFFNGFNLSAISLDRPSISAGNSFVHVIGDEAKYFKEDKISKLLKAVRGYSASFAKSVFYLGRTFTTDMPDKRNIGEYDWILKQVSKMNKDQIMDILKCGLVINEIRLDLIKAIEKKDNDAVALINRKLERWNERYVKIRNDSTLFVIASTLINSDILTEKYLFNEIDSSFEDIKYAIFSMIPKVEAGDRFYCNLKEHHFYSEGNDSYYSELFGLRDNEDCRILTHLDKDKPLDGGLDCGNMHSLVIAQTNGEWFDCLKDMYTLSPDFYPELAVKFVEYFKYHNNKKLYLYYDRAANNYKDAKRDVATGFKKEIEVQKGKPTGWTVYLMSIGQGNIDHEVEYHFQQVLMSGQNKKLPKLRIDLYNCKELKGSLESAPLHIDSKGRLNKKKTSEKLPLRKRPLESTDFSDAFKYLVCRKDWLKYTQSGFGKSVGDISFR
jgi:hypothetical protein